MVLVLLPGAVSALQSSAATGVCLRQPRSPVYYWQRVSRTVAASIEDEEDLATREVRRRSRLLGDNGPDAEVSGFDELFASLREEEERAVAEAEAEAMSAFLTEIDGDLLDELPPPRRESRSRSSELPRGAGGRRKWDHTIIFGKNGERISQRSSLSQSDPAKSYDTYRSRQSAC